MAIILEKRSYGWSAMFYGIGRMPDDVEIPLPLTSSATLSNVVAHMRNCFPDAVYLWRNNGKLCSTDGWTVCDTSHD
jgi:hypothetical protein